MAFRPAAVAMLAAGLTLGATIPAASETTEPVYSGPGWKAGTVRPLLSIHPDPYYIVKSRTSPARPPCRARDVSVMGGPWSGSCDRREKVMASMSGGINRPEMPYAASHSHLGLMSTTPTRTAGRAAIPRGCGVCQFNG